jgi:hypothetical protein
MKMINTNKTQSEQVLSKSGIKRVAFYIATPVETCDRCSAGIKYVAQVEYKDGTAQKYGSECINKILKEVPDMRTLWNKNSKLLKQYQDALGVLTRKPEDMPRGSEYFGSGLYFVADSTGKDIQGGKSKHWYFHPVFDQDKNAANGRYVVKNVEEHRAKCMKEVNQDLPWFKSEIERLEAFLAKVLQKAQQVASPWAA